MSGPEPFKLYAGHPALELVNTLDLRFSDQALDLIPTYRDLLRFTTQLELLTTEQARKLGVPSPRRKRNGCWHPRSGFARRSQPSFMPGWKAASPRLHRFSYWNNSSTERRCIDGSWQAMGTGSGAGRAQSGNRKFRCGCWPRRPRICWCRAMRTGQGLRRPNLPLAFSRCEQEPHPALVRHEDLRQPHESAKTPRACPRRRRLNRPQDLNSLRENAFLKGTGFSPYITTQATKGFSP